MPHQLREYSVGEPLLKKREKWRTHSYFRSLSKTNPRYTSPLNWRTREETAVMIAFRQKMATPEAQQQYRRRSRVIWIRLRKLEVAPNAA